MQEAPLFGSARGQQHCALALQKSTKTASVCPQPGARCPAQGALALQERGFSTAELVSTGLVSTRLISTHESKTSHFPRISRSRRKNMFFFTRETDGSVQKAYFLLVETSLGYRPLD